MKRLIYLLVLSMLLVGGTWTQTNAAGPYVEKAVSQAAAQSAVDYWTPARLRNAKPSPLPLRSGEASKSNVLPPSTAAPKLISYPARNGQSALLSEDEFDALAYTGAFGEAAGVVPMDYPYPPPHTTFRVPDYLYGSLNNYYPYATIGRIFFTDGVFNYSCSGAVTLGRAVLTAGHCVADGAGNWYSQHIFIPSFRWSNWPSPPVAYFGVWSADWMITTSDWFNTGQFGRDVAFMAVNFPPARAKISAYVGGLGLAANFPRDVHWNMFGYPAAAPFTGQFMYTTEASLSFIDISMAPATNGMGTYQTAGCSGGPWIWRFFPGPGPRVGPGAPPLPGPPPNPASSGQPSPTEIPFPNLAYNYTNGVNSYVYILFPNEIYSPYFDTLIFNMALIAIAQ